MVGLGRLIANRLAPTGATGAPERSGGVGVDLPCGVDPQHGQAQALDDLRRGLALLQHQQGADGPGQQAAGGGDADRLEVLHWPAGVGVEDVAVALAALLKVAFVVARGGQRLAAQAERGDDLASLPGMADADGPGAGVGFGADADQVAPEVDEGVLHAVLAQNGGGAVGGVFLADAAQVDLHAGSGQVHAAGLALYAGPANQGAQGIELRGAGALRGLKIPGPAQDATGQVKQAAALLVHAVGKVKKLPGFRVDGNGALPGCGVDAADQAVALVAGVFGFDATDFVDGALGLLFGPGPAVDWL